VSASLVIEDDGSNLGGRNVELPSPEVQFMDGIDAVILLNL
jgi:hypothetical protein